MNSRHQTHSFRMVLKLVLVIFFSSERSLGVAVKKIMIYSAVKKLKKKKSRGFDQISAQDLFLCSDLFF